MRCARFKWRERQRKKAKEREKAKERKREGEGEVIHKQICKGGRGNSVGGLL